MVRRGMDRLARWIVAHPRRVVAAAFVLTLVGTFLTRSGVVESVHSFTASPIGPWFAAAILVALVGSLALLLWRLPDLGDTRPPGRPVSPW